jgi:hypothetical protein
MSVFDPSYKYIYRMHAYQPEEKVLELFPGRNFETGQWNVVPDLSRTFLEPKSNVSQNFTFSCFF